MLGGGPGPESRHQKSSRVWSSFGEALVGTRLTLVWLRRPRKRACLQEVLWWFRTEEGHLRQAFSSRSRARSRGGGRNSSRSSWGGPEESLLLQLQPLLQRPVTLHLTRDKGCMVTLGLTRVTMTTLGCLTSCRS